MITTLTITETIPGHFDWVTPSGNVIAHNVPRGESPALPEGWEWVDARTVIVRVD